MNAYHPKKRLAVWIVVDLIMLAACLMTFAYFHHVRVVEYTPSVLASPTAAPTPEPEVTPAPDGGTGAAETTEPAEPTEEPTPTPDTSGLLQGRFSEKFSLSGVENTDTGYRSAKVRIELSTVQTEEPCLTYYLADIYIQDISSFKTAVAIEYKDQNPASITSTMDAKLLSGLVGSIVSISGDNFYPSPSGRWIVRNGAEWVRKEPMGQDICVLYYDGVMETYTKNEIDFDAITARKPYQIWAFGPELLVNGQATDTFSVSNGSGNNLNPRAAIGYYEPGHYCFLLADGRQKNYSLGMTYADMSKLFFELGCTAAYNLDGGDTAVMCRGDQWLSHPQDEDPRPGSDLLYIVEPDGAEVAQ